MVGMVVAHSGRGKLWRHRGRVAEVGGVILGHWIGCGGAEVAGAAHGLLVRCREGVRVQRPEEVWHHSVASLLGFCSEFAVPGLNPVLLQRDRTRDLKNEEQKNLKTRNLFQKRNRLQLVTNETVDGRCTTPLPPSHPVPPCCSAPPAVDWVKTISDNWLEAKHVNTRYGHVTHPPLPEWRARN